MGFFNKFFGRILLVFQFILVFLFILFEEIIWEGIAKPIYNQIQALEITQRIAAQIEQMNRYIVLTIFSVLLLGVEVAGLLAGAFFVQGHVMLGLLLYIAKIPIAAFVFWLFNVAKEKLLSFNWFNWSYQKLMAGIEWLKSRVIYQNTMAYMLKMKSAMKAKWKAFKAKYFQKESTFVKELKAFYIYIKNFKKNMKRSTKEDKKSD